MAFEATTEVRATRRWLLAALLVYVGVGFFTILHALPIDGRSLVWMLLLLVGEGAFALAHLYLPKVRRGRIVADESGLYVDGKRIAPRASIRSAHGFERRGVRWLRLMRLWGQADVAVDGETERALLHALRLDPHGIVTRYVLTPYRRKSRPVRAQWAAVLLMPLLLLFLASRPFSLATKDVVFFAIGSAYLGMLLRMFELVRIGADGIRVRRLIGSSRYVPFADMRSLEVLDRDIVVSLRGGAEIAWHTPRGSLKRIRERDLAVAARVQEGIENHRATSTANAVAKLARGSRALKAWLDDARAIGDPSRTTYRVAPFAHEELWDVVVNVTAPASARVGAAIALQRDLDDAGRKRLHDVAMTCASDSLRGALDATADDAAVETWIAALRD